MILTDRAIAAIGKELRIRLAFELNITEQWVIKLLAGNTPNNRLTSIAAVRIIKRYTGLSDKEVLRK